MKTIQPVQIWQNGSVKIATIFNLTLINDNLENSGTFYYSLLDENIVNLSQGNLTIDGEEYQNWDSEPSANEYAYTWAADMLSLVITGEYIPPAPQLEAPQQQIEG